MTKQNEYNKRYRDKQAKIKRLCRELDDCVKRLEEGRVESGARDELRERAEAARRELMVLDH